MEQSSRKPQSAQEVADEAKAALRGLQATFKQRDEALEQQVQALKQEKESLRQDKERLLQQAQAERRSFDSEREQLSSENFTLSAEFASKDATIKRLTRVLAEKEKEWVERLRQQLREQLRTRQGLAVRMQDAGREAREREEELERTVEQLQTQLREQTDAFEQERETWKKKQGESKVSASLEKAVPHLRTLLETYEQEKQGGSTNSQQVGVAEERDTALDLDERLREQQNAFDQERAKLLEQASNAVKSQKDIHLRSLNEREAVLTCPISFELFENPVVTECCGKTFSSEAMVQAIAVRPTCPFCRAPRVVYHANRDVAKLVEFHRVERSILQPQSSPTNPREESIKIGAARLHQILRQYQELRQERVRARSEVPHRRSSAPSDQSPETIASSTSRARRLSPSYERRSWPTIARAAASAVSMAESPYTPPASGDLYVSSAPTEDVYLAAVYSDQGPEQTQVEHAPSPLRTVEEFPVPADRSWNWIDSLAARTEIATPMDLSTLGEPLRVERVLDDNSDGGFDSDTD